MAQGIVQRGMAAANWDICNWDVHCVISPGWEASLFSWKTDLPVLSQQEWENLCEQNREVRQYWVTQCRLIMENKFDPFYNKEPTLLGASVVPLAVFGLTEINYTILLDCSFPFLSSRLVQSGESWQNLIKVGPRLCRWTERFEKEHSRSLPEITNVLF